MEKGKVKLDAGLKSLNHYQQKLPGWRYWLRQRLLPLIRWETPYLAWLQERTRTPFLDSWFAITANLGTHTFYMVMLPIIFWCGYTRFGRGVVHLLATGVFFSGFIKDLLCLPRPLSPPLHRITMSGSAALEYGFPSTHSTNAVSVVYYSLWHLNSLDSSLSPAAKIGLQVGLSVYAVSIVVGRLYCGMHGFTDVVVGSMLGAILGFLQCSYGNAFDEYLYSGTIKDVFTIILVIIVFVRIHPEPADSCPCFDDSVAFAGVLIGAQLGCWQFSKSSFSVSDPSPATIPYSFQSLGLAKTALRIIIGVVMVFVWREIMKPSLLRFLPPLFRVIERLGLSLPRRFFTRASEYTRVPDHLKDDDVIPNVSEIPSMLSNIRHPRRRAISVGPQSEADAYETLAYREKRRTESNASERKRSPNNVRLSQTVDGLWDVSSTNCVVQAKSAKSTRGLAEYEHMMGTGTPVNERDTDVTSVKHGIVAQDEEDMFSMITRPRVRYDVEVVTKLIVYSGIGWLSVMLAPRLFYYFGLSP
ncbi:hypothetical protein VTO42DRAFT_8552 [Malbranchea cinnamomea]